MNAVTMNTGTAQTTAYSGLIDAIGGIAAGVLAIIGLNGFDPEGMAAIAAIVLGAALVIQASGILSEYTRLLSQSQFVLAQNPAGLTHNPLMGGEGLGALFMVGAAGIVLGILALLGIASAVLTSVALIAFGSALVLSSGAARQLFALRSQSLLATGSPRELLAAQMICGSAGIQLMSGLAAVVLGILAVAGHMRVELTLVGLLVLGVTVLLTGSALSSVMLTFVRPSHGLQSTTNRAV